MSFRYAECGEAVQDGDTDLELRDLAVEVPRHEALTQQFHAMHFGFDAALLHKSGDRRTSPFPGQTYPMASVTGMPSAVKPFMTATRTWTRSCREGGGNLKVA